jgi:hypothetical protein
MRHRLKSKNALSVTHLDQAVPQGLLWFEKRVAEGMVLLCQAGYAAPSECLTLKLFRGQSH